MFRLLTITMTALAAFTMLYCDFDSSSAGTEGQLMTFEQFKSSIYQVPDSDIYIVEGDWPIHGEDALINYYEKNFVSKRLAVHKDNNNQLDKWDDYDKKNITYCVSYPTNNQINESNKHKFHKYISDLVERSANEWEEASGYSIDFKHVTSQDENCSPYNRNVLFDVHYKYMPAGYRIVPAAYAFVPSFERSKRSIVINIAVFDKNQTYAITQGFSLQDVLTHEMGHALGFVHEHGRHAAVGKVLSSCAEYRWMPSLALTDYDRYSIMHYPHCRLDYDDSGEKFFRMTPLDRQGIKKLYGSN